MTREDDDAGAAGEPPLEADETALEETADWGPVEDWPDWVAAAERAAIVEADSAAYERQPERPDEVWRAAEAWSEE